MFHNDINGINELNGRRDFGVDWECKIICHVNEVISICSIRCKYYAGV